MVPYRDLLLHEILHGVAEAHSATKEFIIEIGYLIED